MKQSITLLLMLLLFSVSSFAETKLVTNANDSGDGSFRAVVVGLQPDDVVMFDESLDDDTIWITSNVVHTFSSGSGNRGKSLTIIGNGVVIASKASPLYTLKMEYSENTLENMHFYNCGLDMNNTSGTQKLIRCSIKKTLHDNSQMLLVGKYTAASAADATFYAENCYFYGGATSLASMAIGGSITNYVIASAEFVSCTFEDGVANSYKNIFTPTTFTNCVIYQQKGYNSSSPSFNNSKNHAIAFKGYNVVKGTFFNSTVVTSTSTDVISADMQRNPLALHDGFYKPVIDGPAYQHLPAGPPEVEGVTFPTHDVLGNEIDYTQATHSGAIQEAVSYTYLESIAFPSDELTLYAGDEPTDLAALLTFTPADADNRKVVWTKVSFTPAEGTSGEVITLDADGKVTPVGEGTAVVKATSDESDGISDEITITVGLREVVNVTGVALNLHTLELDKDDETEQLIATVSPADASYPGLTWTSSNEAVATVSVSGVVTSHAVGTATIRATSDNKPEFYDECVVTVVEPSYTDGVYFLNEDWYTHNESTINFLISGGRWKYRVFQKNNPGLKLGDTSQHGAIYGGRMYITSKQHYDDNGGRFHIAGAVDMKVQKLHRDVSTGGDGRAFVGVDEGKGYVSTSDGVYIIDLATQEFSGSAIAGTEGAGSGDNPLDMDKYSAQVGTMVRVGDRVFAVHQVKGLLVINAETDEVETVLKGDYNYLTCTLAGDGNLYSSAYTEAVVGGVVNKTMVNALIKTDPYTLQSTEIPLPAGYDPPASHAGWGWWRADAIFASHLEKKLYWKIENGGKKVLYYDIDGNAFGTALDLTAYDYNGKSWKIYGSGVGIHPVTDEIYAVLHVTDGQQFYTSIKANPHTGEITTYPMNNGYWFTAMPIFPDNHLPIVSDALADVTIAAEKRISLNDKVTDVDNLEVAIVKSIASIADPTLISARIWRDTLIITPLRSIPAENEPESTELTLKFNSNGNMITKTITVTALPTPEPPYVPPTPDPELEPTPPAPPTPPSQPGTVSLNTTDLRLTQGERSTLTVTVTPGLTGTPQWSTSRPSVADVTAGGTVIAIAPGTALITVSIGNISASCMVTVSEQATEPVAAFSASSPRVYYSSGSLRLVNLAGHDCAVITLGGRLLTTLRIASPEETHPLTLSKGVYILTTHLPPPPSQRGGGERQVFKFVVF
jgi:uncharacterized protein YjdB